jgi:hypothetical protein
MPVPVNQSKRNIGLTQRCVNGSYAVSVPLIYLLTPDQTLGHVISFTMSTSRKGEFTGLLLLLACDKLHDEHFKEVKLVKFVQNFQNDRFNINFANCQYFYI